LAAELIYAVREPDNHTILYNHLLLPASLSEKNGNIRIIDHGAVRLKNAKQGLRYKGLGSFGLFAASATPWLPPTSI
jgi:hypothetical protein